MSRRDLFLHKGVEGRILFRQDNAEAGDAFQDAIYHLCGRGNARQRIFQDERDRARFVQLLAESARRFDGTVLCFVLMSNHFHHLEVGLLAHSPKLSRNRTAFSQSSNSRTKCNVGGAAGM